MVLDIIEKSKNQKTLVGFNFYSSDNGFYCGFVLNYNEDFVIIQHFTKFGLYDGLLVHKLTDIKYFETETVYLNGIQLLIGKQNKILEQTFQLKNSNEFVEGFSNLFEHFIGNKDYLIKFELTDDEIYFGFVEWCDDNYFSIINIDNDGILIGKATFKFEDLNLYWIDDLECRKRKIFYDAKNASS